MTSHICGHWPIGFDISFHTYSSIAPQQELRVVSGEHEKSDDKAIIPAAYNGEASEPLCLRPG